jgi:hypothetical protein
MREECVCEPWPATCPAADLQAIRSAHDTVRRVFAKWRVRTLRGPPPLWALGTGWRGREGSVRAAVQWEGGH